MLVSPEHRAQHTTTHELPEPWQGRTLAWRGKGGVSPSGTRRISSRHAPLRAASPFPEGRFSPTAPRSAPHHPSSPEDRFSRASEMGPLARA